MNRTQRSFAAIVMALGVCSTPVMAQDGAAIYQDVCGRCHGLLEEQSWQRFLPGDGAVLYSATAKVGFTIEPACHCRPRLSA